MLAFVNGYILRMKHIWLSFIKAVSKRLSVIQNIIDSFYRRFTTEATWTCTVTEVANKCNSNLKLFAGWRREQIILTKQIAVKTTSINILSPLIRLFLSVFLREEILIPKEHINFTLSFFLSFFWRNSSQVGHGLLIHEVTQLPTTVGRTPLDEWSARRRHLYLTTHNTHNRQTSMPPVGFEHTISAGERPQTARPVGLALVADRLIALFVVWWEMSDLR